MRPKTTGKQLPPRMLARTRTLKSGKVWTGYYYNGRDESGGRVEIPLGTDIHEAKRKWAELECKPLPPDTGVMQVVFDRYVRDIIPTKAPKTQRENLSMLKLIRGVFDTAPIDAVKPAHIAQYRDTRGKSAPVRANRELSLLSHVFNMAREWGFTDKENPCRGVRKLKESPRQFYADNGVWDAVQACAPADLQFAMRLAYLTGQRPADVLKMSTADIQDGYLIVRQNKTAKRLMIGVTGELAELIEQRTRRPSVCPALVLTHDGKAMSQNMLRNRWDDARIAAKAARPDLADKITQFQFRDIRPKAASEVTLKHAQELLGHSTQRMTLDVYRRAGEKVDPTR